MGNRNTKSSLRNAIIYLNISADRISAKDDKFWDQIFSEESNLAEEIIKSIRIQEIRMLRDGSPKNFSLLIYKMIECLHLSTGTLCNTHSQQTAVLNAIRILTRAIPCVFEDPAWQEFFECNTIEHANNGELKLKYPEKTNEEKNFSSYLPIAPGHGLFPAEPSCSALPENRCNINPEIGNLLLDEESFLGEFDHKIRIESDKEKERGHNAALESQSASDRPTLMEIVIISICDLLFCPEFTTLPHNDNYPSRTVDGPPEDLKSLSTYDYVWEPGVGFESTVNSTTCYDKNRTELLKTLLVSFSSTMYLRPEKSNACRNRWIEIFVSHRNRHALPIFTSLVNVIFANRTSRSILQFTNSSSTSENREYLISAAIHILVATLDYKIGDLELNMDRPKENSFIEYMSRIHRAEDFNFITLGFTRLLNHDLIQKYSWTSNKQLELDLELMLLFWKICNYNRKFLTYVLNSKECLDIVVPMLYHLNKNFQDPSRTALIHLGVFNLLVLSGERNFGVKLNKQYSSDCLSDLPEFNGSHADLMIIVFHKLIMYGYKINQLYDYLLNILVNISPYLKGLSILASKCLIQLFETFSSAYVILTEPNYHQLVIFLLEIFNNLIQYQFDSNANIIYIILTKRDLFMKLAKLPTSQDAIDKVLRKLTRRKMRVRQLELDVESQEDSKNNDANSTMKCKAIDDLFDFDLATVSCEISRNQHDSSPSRQEVSLVATPDIKHFTQPTHPFIQDNEALPNGEELNRLNREPSKSTFNIDDILDRSANYPHIRSDFRYCSETYDDSNSESSVITDTKTIYDIDTMPQISQHSDKKQDEVHAKAKLRAPVQDADTNTKKWKPRSQWLIEWKRTLPLHTVIRMIQVLVPQIDQLKKFETRVDESEVIKFLQNGTLVGLLPVPHPILIRKYRTNNDSTIWFRACTWAIIYVKSMAWIDSDIRLIRIL